MPQTFIVVQQPDGSLKNVEAFNFLDANGNTVFAPAAVLVDDAGVELAGQKSKATSIPVVLASDQESSADPLYVAFPPDTLGVSVVSTDGAALTLTLPAAGANLHHHVTMIELALYSVTARTGSATPIVVTTANIPALSIPFKTFAAVGELDRYQYAGRSLRSNTANAASTIVMPAVVGGRWYAAVHYSARAAG